MSKAILVIDNQTPKQCQYCIFRVMEVERDYCYIEKKDLEREPEWCPLQEVPEKKEKGSVLRDAIKNDCYDGSAEDRSYFDGKECGYNQCIDEILKGGSV